jgi:hypothetical protein
MARKDDAAQQRGRATGDMEHPAAIGLINPL